MDGKHFSVNAERFSAGGEVMNKTLLIDVYKRQVKLFKLISSFNMEDVKGYEEGAGCNCNCVFSYLLWSSGVCEYQCTDCCTCNADTAYGRPISDT